MDDARYPRHAPPAARCAASPDEHALGAAVAAATQRFPLCAAELPTTCTSQPARRSSAAPSCQRHPLHRMATTQPSAPRRVPSRIQLSSLCSMAQRGQQLGRSRRRRHSARSPPATPPAASPPHPTPRRPPHSAVVAAPRQARSRRGGVRRWCSQPTRRRPPRSAAATAARSLGAASSVAASPAACSLAARHARQRQLSRSPRLAAAASRCSARQSPAPPTRRRPHAPPPSHTNRRRAAVVRRHHRRHATAPQPRRSPRLAAANGLASSVARTLSRPVDLSMACGGGDRCARTCVECSDYRTPSAQVLRLLCVAVFVVCHVTRLHLDHQKPSIDLP